MILRKSLYTIWGLVVVTLTFPSVAEEAGPTYDTSEWIPIAPKNIKREEPAERRASGRVLNLNGPNRVSYTNDEYIKTSPQQYLREVSPVINNQRPKIVSDQPYKFEDVLVPSKNQLKTDALQSKTYQSLPLPANVYQNQVPNYVKLPEEPNQVLNQNYQQQYQIPINNSYYQSLNPDLINFELVQPENPTYSKVGEDKSGVQLLYVPLEQLQQQRDHLQKEVIQQRQQIQLHDKLMQNILNSGEAPIDRRPPRPEIYSHSKQQTEQSYIVPQVTDYPVKLNQYQSNQVLGNNQKSRLESIKQDFIQQALEAQKLQQQIRQEEPILYQTTTSKPKSKKRKPHQPPLAIYYDSENQKVNINDVLDSLQSSQTIAVQDFLGPSSPQIFVGPSNLNIPESFKKFPLPYLSNINGNILQRKQEDLPFFVAPLNYKTPNGYYKIPLPSPHVGSIVVSQRKLQQFQDLNQKEQAFSGNVNSIANQNAFISENVNSDTKLVTQRTTINEFHPSQTPLRQYQEQNLYQQISRFTQPESSTSRLNNYDTYSGFAQETPVKSFNNPRNQYIQTTSRTQFVPPVENYSIRSNPLRNNNYPTISSVTEENYYAQTTPEPPKIRRPSPYPSLFEDISQPQYFNNVPSNVQVTQTDRIASIQQNNLKVENELSTFLSTTPPNQEILYNPTVSTNAPVQQYLEASTASNQNNAVPSRGSENYIKNVQQDQADNQEEVIRVNENLPGLVNNLQDQAVRTLYSPNLLVPTTQKQVGKHDEESKIITENYLENSSSYIQTTPSTTTTTKKLRGRHRGGSRFNVQSTTVASRKTVGRRRPSNIRTTTEQSIKNDSSNNGEVRRVTTSRFRTRTRPTSTEHPEEVVETKQRVQEVSTEPVSYMQYESIINNERVVQTIGNPPVDSEELIKISQPYYESNKHSENYEQTREEPVKVLNVNLNHATYTEPSTKRNSVVYSQASEEPTVTESQRPKIRVRGRTRAKTRPSTTATPSTSRIEQEEDNKEFYGFIRQPNFERPIQQSEKNILIYPPAQEPKEPLRIEEEPENTVHFVGQIRPKFQTSVTQDTTTEIPKTTTSKFRRTRVRVPGRNYQSSSRKDDVTTERSRSQQRSRGKSHFNPPRSIREKEEDELEGQNYPAAFLKSRETISTASSFQITVKPDQEEDQVPYSSDNKPNILITGSNEWVEASDYHTASGDIITSSEATSSEMNQSMELLKEHVTESLDNLNAVDTSQNLKNKKKGVWKIVKHKVSDNIETAESQDFRSQLNLIQPSEKNYQIQLNDSGAVQNEVLTTMEPSVNTTNMENIILDSIYTMLDIGHNNSSEESSEALEQFSEINKSPTQMSLTSTSSDDLLSTTLQNEIKERVDDNHFSTEAVEKIDNIYPVTEASDFTAKTSISTEISHQTEMCFKGHCVKRSV